MIFVKNIQTFFQLLTFNFIHLLDTLYLKSPNNEAKAEYVEVLYFKPEYKRRIIQWILYIVTLLLTKTTWIIDVSPKIQ
jgi:hypothetical protein